MEELIGLLLVALLFTIIIAPIVILIKLSSIRSCIKILEEQNRKISSLLEKQGGKASEHTPEIKNPAPEVIKQPEPVQTQPLIHKEENRIVGKTIQPAPVPPPLPLSQPASPLVSKDQLKQESAPKVLKPTEQPARKPETKSRFAESAREIFRKIWRWILVGEEYQPKGVSAETAIASTWMLRIFVMFVVAAVAYILKLSIERQWLGPAPRFAVGIAFGIAMLISGIKLLRTRYKMIGEGLLGGGIVVLYLCIYAADVMYQLMPTPLAFALMALITVTAGLLAVRLDSMLVAIFGIIGGYLTPLALSTTVLSLPGFYTYILILSIAVLVIALAKQWRLLNYLGFILTYGLFFLHSMEHYDKTTDFPTAITFLTLLFVVQSLTVCIHNIIRKQQSTMIEAIHLILNALIYSAGGYFLIIEAHGRPWPSIMSLWLAVFYLLYITMFLRRGLKDRLLLLCLISLSAAYTAWTLPLVLEKESLTIAFALLAFIFLWLGRKVKSNFLQSLSYLLYGAVFYRVAFMDMPGNYSLKAPAATSWVEYFKNVADRLFTFGTSIGSIIGAFLLSRREPDESSIIFEENDINAAIPAKASQGILFWVSVIFVFVFLNLEINTMFRCWEPMRLPMLTMLWGLLILFLFARMLSSEKKGHNVSLLKTITVMAIGITLIKLFSVDAHSWHLNHNFIYNKDYALLDICMRLLDFGFILTVILLIWRTAIHGRTKAFNSTQFGYTALGLFFFFCTFELRTLLYWKLESFLPAGISILWALFAVSFILFGISWEKGSLRATGLVLFTIVCAKVVLLDLKDLAIIYRIIALLVVGVTLLLGSFAYLKSGSSKEETGDDKFFNVS